MTTIGVVQVWPGVPNVVPARATLVQEIRDADPAVLERLARRTLLTARRVAGRRGLTVEVEEVVRAEPVRLSPRVQAAIEAAAETLGLATRRMPSGATHDAQILAQVTDAGMLFVFPRAQHLTFWMKNTVLPLDMIFIGDDRRVVGIVKDAVPYTTTPREVAGDSRYVLEVNAGFSERHGVRAGDAVTFEGVSGAS